MTYIIQFETFMSVIIFVHYGVVVKKIGSEARLSEYPVFLTFHCKTLGGYLAFLGLYFWYDGDSRNIYLNLGFFKVEPDKICV